MNVLTCEQLKARLDAVVAENVALKEFIKKEYSGTMVRVINDDGPAGWDCIDYSPRTVATSAALAEVEAKAIETLATAFEQHIKAAGLADEDSVTVLECKEALKHVVELREDRV